MFLRSRSFGVLTSSTLKSLGNGSKCLSTKWTGQEVIGSNNKKSGVSDLKPVDMSFAAFESKAKDAIKKDPLVIMHSLLGRKKNWKTVAMEIHHLTRKKVVSVDARNHGDSPHTPEMSYSLLAKDLAHFIKKMNIEKVNFMGHSMGGRVGMILALTQPQFLNKLICVDSTPVNSPVGMERWKTLGEACRLLRDMEPELRRETGVSRSILADKLVRPILPNQYDRSVFLANLMVTKEKGQNAERLWRINIDAIINNPQLTRGFPQFKDVQFNGRALFIAGEKSKYLKKEHESEIYKLFPNAKVVILPDCGHWLHLERHKEFMHHIVRFLEAP